MSDRAPSATHENRAELDARARGPSSEGRFAPLAALATIAVLAALALVLVRHPRAPEVNFTTITGEKFDTASLKGKVVVVNFWATSCLYCMHEMPGVVNTYQRLHDKGLDVVAVAMDYDPPSYVLDYAQSRRLPFKVALDSSGDAAAKFGHVDATPTTVVIDRDGQIVARYVGELEFETLEPFLEKQLAKPQART
jgi:peroxiredoxin